jgi:hypothetical protein
MKIKTLISLLLAFILLPSQAAILTKSLDSRVAREYSNLFGVSMATASQQDQANIRQLIRQKHVATTFQVYMEENAMEVLTKPKFNCAGMREIWLREIPTNTYFYLKPNGDFYEALEGANCRKAQNAQKIVTLSYSNSLLYQDYLAIYNSRQSKSKKHAEYILAANKFRFRIFDRLKGRNVQIYRDSRKSY